MPCLLERSAQGPEVPEEEAGRWGEDVMDSRPPHPLPLSAKLQSCPGSATCQLKFN